MTGLGELRRLEQWLTYVRWFGVFFAAASVTTQVDYPPDGTEQLAWILVAVLAVGNLIIWGALARITDASAQARLGFAAFALDIVVVMGFVWIFAFETPYVTWALLFLIPMEGSLRYRLKGALAGALFVALFFVPQSFRFANLHGGEFEFTTYIFVVGLSTLIAGISGAMADNWHEQRLAFEQQSFDLADADRLKDRFLAVTSHEIRGPLTAIIAGLDTIKTRAQRLSTEQKDRLLDMMSMQADQLARLVDDLTVTSQIQAHKLALQKDWSGLEETVEQALHAAVAKRRSHRLEVFLEPLHCEVDHFRVAQIVRNLVENAYKYTPDRTPVSVTAKGSEGGIVIEVADAGEGIPVDKRNQLFEAFSRIEETAAGREGVGLGLYVVSQLVAAMDGRIDLASSSKGTTFSIYIPCAKTAGYDRRLGLVRDESEQASS